LQLVKVPMNLVPTRPVPPGDDLDGLLRAYFRKEMPTRWPAPPPPVAHAPGSPRIPPVAHAPGSPTLPFRRPTPRGLFRSRLALVASVTLLVLGSLFVSGKTGPDRPTDLNPLPALGPGGATKPRLPPEKIKTSLSLEQDPAGETQIKVDVMLEDVPPSR
jgi:hypothetical protein